MGNIIAQLGCCPSDEHADQIVLEENRTIDRQKTVIVTVVNETDDEVQKFEKSLPFCNIGIGGFHEAIKSKIEMHHSGKSTYRFISYKHFVEAMSENEIWAKELDNENSVTNEILHSKDF